MHLSSHGGSLDISMEGRVKAKISMKIINRSLNEEKARRGIWCKRVYSNVQ